MKRRGDRHFARCRDRDQASASVRIGANWGSLRSGASDALMDENARSPNPRDARELRAMRWVQSALLSAARAEEIGFSRDRTSCPPSIRSAGPDRSLL